MTRKETALKLDMIQDQISKLLEEAERIKTFNSNYNSFDKENFENLLNTYENSSEVVKNMFISYIIDTHYDSLFL